MLNQYEKRAIARISKEKTDAEREAIGQDDALARELIAAAKNTRLGYAVSRIEEYTEQLALAQIEKDIWENVEGLPVEQQPEI
jgi:ribosomal protein S7